MYVSFSAHLVSYSSRRNSELHETGNTICSLNLVSHTPYFSSTNLFNTLFIGSDIYEDPRVRFEYKKTIPSDPVRMETYLVRDLHNH